MTMYRENKLLAQAHKSHIVPGWLTRPSLFMHVEAYEDLPQACMQDSVTRLFEVYEVIEQISVVF